nr:MAG TPA: hypothetical protein [Caudoviricetes sp.]
MMGRRLVYQLFHFQSLLCKNCTAFTICFLSEDVNNQKRNCDTRLIVGICIVSVVFIRY